MYDTYKHFYADNLCYKFIGAHGAPWSYTVDYRLPEDLVITPSASEQFYKSSARNRYIRSVTVKASSTTTTTNN